MKPYVQTYSVCVGGSACNATCPYCVSRMTNQIEYCELDRVNLIRGAELARLYGAGTLLITGKGEPTIYRKDLVKVLKWMKPYFPIMELQTNGILIDDKYIRELSDYGLSTLCVSAVHWKTEMNKIAFGNKYQDIFDIARLCKEYGITMRLSLMLIKGYIDSVENLDYIIDICKIRKIHQLTIRELGVSNVSGNKEVQEYIENHKVDFPYRKHIESKGTLVNTLVHGVNVYDVEGQNVCIANCLTMEKATNDVRQLIYCPDGHIRYDWQYNGAIVV